MAEKEKRAVQEHLSQSEEEKTEDKIEDKIRGMAEDIEVPDSLKPEAVEKMLSARRLEKRRRRMWKYAGIAAACICLAAGIGYGRRTVWPKPSDGQRKDAATAETSEEMPADTAEGGGGIACARDYEEIYGYIDAASKNAAWEYENLGISAEDTAASMPQGGGTSAKWENSGEYSAGGDYSDTNVREEGVGEGDIVKTDGKYLYVMGERNINIVGIESSEMEKVSEITADDDGFFSELYVEDGRLAAVYSKSIYACGTGEDSEDGASGADSTGTSVYVYDISDAAHPKLEGTFSQSGFYNTMRVKDGYVYLITNFYAGIPADPMAYSYYVPQVQDKTLEPENIYIPARQAGREYTMISAFAMDNPQQETDSAAVFGNAGMCYVSGENIYITEGIYDGDKAVTQTSVSMISYGGGRLKAKAGTKLDGTLKDSFCIDEYDGYLRLVTTVSPVYTTGDSVQPMAGTDDAEEPAQTEEEIIPAGGEAAGDSAGSPAAADTNSLYVLDGELKIVGQISNLAAKETVYSARFMGDTGYFVTFRQIDPLFSVDLSDPENPQIIGELKIPGFSEYLHPYGDGLLLGIGMDVDEEAVAAEGVKLSMFDISDPADVQETDTFVIRDTYGTEAGYNYKAAFVDVEKNLFGFTAYSDSADEYYIFTYDKENGFEQVFKRQLGGGWTRGLYAGERFYIVCGNTVESYTLDGFEKEDDIIL